MKRPISMNEAAVIKQALIKGYIGDDLNMLLDSIEHLQVTKMCRCGCASIEFISISGNEKKISDVTGLLMTGSRVDVIIWAKDEKIQALEIVKHEGDGDLPRPDTISTWEEAGKNAF